MSSVLIAIILGIPAALIAAAIVLMVWRAIHPRRNELHGLTNKSGTIVNPYIYLIGCVITFLMSAFCTWRLFVGPDSRWPPNEQLEHRLSFLSLSLLGYSYTIHTYKKFKRYKSAGSRADA